METKTKVFYSDFGAVGDGVTEDFHALKAAHDYANEHNLPVYAEAGKTYYIGAAPIKNREVITIKTSSYWNGATFIFDDAKIPVEHKYPKHIVDGVEVNSEDYIKAGDDETVCQRCLKKISKDPTGCTNRGDGWHTLPVFSIASDNKIEDVTEQFAGSSLMIGDTCLKTASGEVWKPGKTMLVKVECDSIRRYIRKGGNENNGSEQTEMLLVHPDGTIDKDTPVTWDYTKLTKVRAKCVDDEPITVGGGNDDRATIITYANQGPNYYYMYARNIKVTRSNVLLDGINHKIEREGLAEGKCPTGFTQTEFANNVTYKNMRFKRQKSHYDASNKTVLGSYEILAGNSNKISWINCDQWEFFAPNGSVRYWGFFGSNYCRNYYLDGCFLESFDAHCGAYNVTIKNSTFEHINCVGHGQIYVENLTVYTDGAHTGITMRGDYGNTWHGELYAKNLELRSSNADAKRPLSVMAPTYFPWENHYFGYTCRMPEKITLENCRIIKYDYKVEDGKRIETHTAVNSEPMNICAPINKFTDVDISDPNADMTNYPNDWRKCECETFNDTDGDGRCNNWIVSRINHGNRVWCWGFKDEPNKAKNVNPYVPTKIVEIKDCGDLKVVVPPTPQFKNTKVFIDGKEATVAEDGTIVAK